MHHLIRLINDCVPNKQLAGKCSRLGESHVLETEERNPSGLIHHKVLETAGSSNQNVASTTEIVKLSKAISTTMDDTWAEHRSITEAASLCEDLKSQLASWNNDKNQRLSLDCVCDRVICHGIRTRFGELLGLAHEPG